MRNIIFILIISFSLNAQERPLYKNAALPIDLRVSDLLKRMSPEEKFWQLFMIPGDLDGISVEQYRHGIFGFQVSAGSKDGNISQQILNYDATENAQSLAKKINNIQKYFIERSRLGIPIIPFDEALHGLMRDGATAFPQAIGLAASYNTALMNTVANAIAEETKQRGIRQVLTPVVNIASDVRWGRTEETYGEDPYLSSEMAVAFIKAFENKNIITTPKHFVANVGDGGRDSYPIHANERYLEEVHFPPFKAAIKRGGARSIMTAYNSIDGTPASANEWLLNQKLKQEWKFNGFVISDAGATGGSLVLHHTSKSYPESALQAISAGMDVIFQTSYDHYKLFIPHFLDGKIDTNRINDAVSRVLRTKFELGLFENPYVNEIFHEFPSHKEIARKAAQESIVLLKNENEILPFSKKIKTIAVIGKDAVASRLGGYSGPGNGKVSILEGIKNKITGKVLYAEGASWDDKSISTIPSKQLFHKENNKILPGLQAEYFNNTELKGPVAFNRIDNEIDFLWTLYTPDTKIKEHFYSVRWTGYFIAPETDNIKIGLEGNDGYIMYINGVKVIDQSQKKSYNTTLVDYKFEKGKLYDLKIEFFETVGNARIKLIWDYPTTTEKEQKISEALATIEKADVGILVVGIHEGEFQDRAILELPGYQEELILRVTATRKPIVVVLVGGSAITMSKWLPKTKGVLDIWYPGEEGGNAVADVLFGDYVPAGRLPITFPQNEGQLPLVYNHKPTGRGDDYYNLSGEPLFPFGFGLSYSTFEYSDLKLHRNKMTAADSTTLSFTLTNTGKYDGDEVVQLYITDKLSTLARPILELKGFQRIHLRKGESKDISFIITPQMLSMLDKDLREIVEPGEFLIRIGSSSKDHRLLGVLTVIP